MAKTKKNLFSRIAGWFRGMRSELKKIVWPTPKQILKNSLVVLVTIIVVALILWAFDSLASAIVELLIKLFS